MFHEGKELNLLFGQLGLNVGGTRSVAKPKAPTPSVPASSRPNTVAPIGSPSLKGGAVGGTASGPSLAEFEKALSKVQAGKGFIGAVTRGLGPELRRKFKAGQFTKA